MPTSFTDASAFVELHHALPWHKDAVRGRVHPIAYSETLAIAGYTVAVEDRDSDAVTAFRAENGMPEAVAGCHRALVGGYVIEGHVPSADIDRLLSERPDAEGLAVPGMPMVLPGMEFGEGRDAFDVVLVGREGTITVFTSYAAI